MGIGVIKILLTANHIDF